MKFWIAEVNVPHHNKPLFLNYDPSAQPVGTLMYGHDATLLGRKVVVIDTLVVDLLDVNTSKQTFKLKLQVALDWEDDGIIQQELKDKQTLSAIAVSPSTQGTSKTSTARTRYRRMSNYWTGKYTMKPEYESPGNKSNMSNLIYTPELMLAKFDTR